MLRSLLLTPALMLAASLAWAEERQPVMHPYVGTEALVPDERLLSHGQPQDVWLGDLTFRPCSKTLPELTLAERYILGGCRHGRKITPQPWKSLINMTAIGAFNRHGKLPKQIDRAVIDERAADGRMPDENAAWYKSPITGEYPRLDQPEFTPGGVYMRMLTKEEAVHFAQWDSTLKGLLTSRKLLKDGVAVDAVVSPVLYYRYYGETGLLEEGFTYWFAPIDVSKVQVRN